MLEVPWMTKSEDKLEEDINLMIQKINSGAEETKVSSCN
jgi:hypothetical protein